MITLKIKPYEFKSILTENSQKSGNRKPSHLERVRRSGILDAYEILYMKYRDYFLMGLMQLLRLLHYITLATMFW